MIIIAFSIDTFYRSIDTLYRSKNTRFLFRRKDNFLVRLNVLIFKGFIWANSCISPPSKFSFFSFFSMVESNMVESYNIHFSSSIPLRRRHMAMYNMEEILQRPNEQSVYGDELQKNLWIMPK